MAKKEGVAAPLSSPAPTTFRGLQEIGALIPRLARPAFRKRSAEGAQIMADWPAIVGPGLSGMAEPVKLSAGTLTLACGGPAAMEISLMAPMVIERINGHLGRAAVRKLAFIQRAPKAAPTPPAPPPAAVPLPERTEAGIAAMPEGELRAALERLAQGVFARGD